MSWLHETVGWLGEKLVYHEDGHELDRLAETMGAPEADRRLSAIQQLRGIESADAASLLIGALRDADPGVRGGAAEALGAKRAGEAVQPLSVLLGDARQ